MGAAGGREFLRYAADPGLTGDEPERQCHEPWFGAGSPDSDFCPAAVLTGAWRAKDRVRTSSKARSCFSPWRCGNTKSSATGSGKSASPATQRAVAVGGPGGAVVSARFVDLPADFLEAGQPAGQSAAWLNSPSRPARASTAKAWSRPPVTPWAPAFMQCPEEVPQHPGRGNLQGATSGKEPNRKSQRRRN